MEEVEFRNWIEKLQARLLSSIMNMEQQLQSIFESMIAKKQSLCEMLQACNNRFLDLFQQEKVCKRPSVPACPGRMRQGEENKGCALNASHTTPLLHKMGRELGLLCSKYIPFPVAGADLILEDRFMTTLSQSSTSSSRYQALLILSLIICLLLPLQY